MGMVYRVQDTVLDVPVALKVVRPDLAADKRFRKLFDLEVRISARFTHPHIVPLHDLGELADGTPFLGLALATGGSFANWRTDCPPWQELRRLFIELLEALSHLHAAGVLHRDLKPENVLLHHENGPPSVWLADLGLANASGALARKKGRKEGTPGFMAPEQSLGLPREYGAHTDLYSVGVLLWEAVTGDMPFGEHGTALDNEPPPLVPRPGLAVPESLELVLRNLLAPDPMARYDLAADVITELNALGEPDLVREATANRQALVRGGTVAPESSAVLSSGSLPSASILEPESTAEAFLDEAFDVPRWNRPLPGALPAVAAPEPGFGARARGSLALFALRELPLVSRDTQRQALWDHARGVATEGTARVVLVVGEAGSGKTRLAESLLRSLEEDGFSESVRMHYRQPPTPEDGFSGAARSLIRPWNERRELLLRRLQRRLAREVGGMDPSVVEISEQLARWVGLGPEGDDREVPAGVGLREVYRHLEARTWRGLVTLLLDGVTGREDESDGLGIAEAVLRASVDGQENRLLVLVTVRAEAVAEDPTLAERVDALVELGAHRLDLPRLDRRGTEALLAESLTLHPRLKRILTDRCEGNPLFARQLLQEWTSQGWLVDTGSLVYGLAPGVDVDAVLPADATALFLERVERQVQLAAEPEAFRDAVDCLSLAGVSVPAGLLDELVGTELAASLLACGLFAVDREAVRFDHGLMHAALAQRASARSDAATLHLRLSGAWASWGETSGQDVSLYVGRHAHACGAWNEAADSLLVAAERAWLRGRSRDLVEAATLAVDACSRGALGDHRPGLAALWRGRAHEGAGEVQQAAERFGEARQVLTRTGHDQLDAAIAGQGWAAGQAGELGQAKAFYEEAMRTARAKGSVEDEARAVMGLAWVEQQARNFEGADILYTRAIGRFGRTDDTRGLMDATLGRAYVCRRRGDFDEAEELYEEAIEVAQEDGDQVGMARAFLGQGLVAFQRMELERAEQRLREGLSIAEDLGATALMMACRSGLGDLARQKGELERARTLYEACLQWAERQKVFETVIQARLMLALVALKARDESGMYEQTTAAATKLEHVPGHWLWASYQLVVAVMLSIRGDEDGAYSWLWGAQDLGLGDTVDRDTARLLTLLVKAARRQGWRNVRIVAGRLALDQWKALGERERVARLEHLMKAEG